MKKAERQSNLELMRCFLMLCVIIVHYNNGDMGGAFNYVTPGSINYYFIYMMESLAIISVNGFVLLAGYFGYKRTTTSLRKPVGLLLYVIAYNFLFYFIDIALGRQIFNLRQMFMNFLPQNYYVVLYVALLIISPYLNVIIRQLSKKNMLIFIGVLMALFSVWGTLLDAGADILQFSIVGSSTVSAYGNHAGYTIVNFVLIYFIGAAIHKWNLLNWSKWKDAGCYLLISIMIFLLSLKTLSAWYYSNVLVILSSVFLLNFFRKIKVQSRLINIVARATLGIYLISTKSIAIQGFRELFQIPQYCGSSIYRCAVNLVSCSVATFFVCAVMDICCRAATKVVSLGLDKIPVLRINIIELKEEGNKED